jgi:hypothetical protein
MRHFLSDLIEFLQELNEAWDRRSRETIKDFLFAYLSVRNHTHYKLFIVNEVSLLDLEK